MRLSAAAFVFLLTPPVMWASNAVLGRLAVAGQAPLISPLTLNALRWVAALALLLVVVPLVSGRLTTDQRAELLGNWRVHALLGLLSVAAFNALQYAALQTSSAINVTLIAAGGPFFTLVVGRLLFGDRPLRRAWLGSLVSLAGVLVVLTGGNPAQLLHLALARGDLLMVVAALAWALYSWLLRTRRPRLPPLTLLAAQAAWGLALSIPVVALEAAAGELVVTPHWRTLAVVLWVAIGPSLIAFWCWDKGVTKAGPVLPSFFANLTPLIAALLSAGLLGEPPRAYHLVAFLLIAGGIALSQRARAAHAQD